MALGYVVGCHWKVLSQRVKENLLAAEENLEDKIGKESGALQLEQIAQHIRILLLKVIYFLL